MDERSIGGKFKEAEKLIVQQEQEQVPLLSFTGACGQLITAQGQSSLGLRAVALRMEDWPHAFRLMSWPRPFLWEATGGE